MSYSQNNEEEIILEIFKDQPTGRFMDIGAYNGKDFSNTLRLAELGWKGVCVEPSPIPFVDLMKLHRDRPGIQLVNCALNQASGWTLFFDSCGDALSTMNTDHVRKWRTAGVQFQKFSVYSISVEELFKYTGYDFDFVNLDVEMTNWMLYQHIPFELLKKLKVICVEHDGCYADMLQVISPFGFEQHTVNGENAIFVRA